MDKRLPASGAGSLKVEVAPMAALVGTLAWFWTVHALAIAGSALGAMPLRRPWAAWAILALGLLAAVAAVRQVARQDGNSSLADSDRSVDLDGWTRALAALIAVFALFALGFIAALAAWLPVLSYDALGYRIPTIAQWLDAGRISWVASDDPVRNGYPMGLEAIGSVVAAASGSMDWIDVLSVPLIAAGALGVWLMASLAGVRPRLARAAAAAFALAPMNLLNGPSGYVDAAFSGALVALWASAILATEPAYAFAGTAAAAAGMAAALVLSLKGTGAVFLAAVVLLVAGRVYRSQAFKKANSAWFAIFVLPGLFWMARNAIHTGNIFWPMDVKVLGYHLFPGVASVESVMDAAHNTPSELRNHAGIVQVALTWLQTRGPATDFDDRLAGLGYAWPLLALPSIGWCAVRATCRRDYLGPASFPLLLAGVCFAAQPMRWWPRYTLWLWAAGALSLAVTGEELAAKGRTRMLGAGLVALAVLCIGEGAFALYHAKAIGPQLRAALSARRFESNPGDARQAAVRLAGLDAGFWKLGLERSDIICRGAWRPDTDNANLDGLFAQLTPRPRIAIIADDSGDWPAVKRRWLESECRELILFAASPALPEARRDNSVEVQAARAFDPLFIVTPGVKRPGLVGR